MKHFITTSIVSALMLILFSNLGYSQWLYDFGTGTGNFTSTTASTTFLPSPPNGTARVRVGTNPGLISMVNPGLTGLGTNTELQITSNTGSTSTTKFSVYDYTSGKAGYVKFKIAFSGGTNGVYKFSLGDGVNFSDNNAIATTQIFSGIEWTFGASNTVSYKVLNGTTYGTTGISNPTTLFIQSTTTIYQVEVYANNNSTSSNYDRAGTTYSLSSATWDLWVDGIRVGTGLAKGGIGSNVIFDSYAFNHQTSATAPGTLYLDDIEYFNSLPTTPTSQTSAINFTNVTTSAFDIGWTNGNGSYRAVFMREGDAGSITNPTSGTTYNASANWSSKGTQLGTSGYYCVYNGSSNTVSLTGLSAGTTYYVQAFEYNGTGTASNFYTGSGSGNPNSQSTSSAGTPTVTLSTSTLDFGSTTVNTISTVQSYTISGSNLTGNITITPPTGFQISSSNSPFSSESSITLAQSGGVVANTTIYVRFVPTTVSTYNANITNVSTGTNSPNLNVLGTGTSPSNPAIFTATVTNQTEIALTATSNTNNNSIVVVYNGTGTFSTPTDGVAPGNTGDSLAGGTIVFKGDATSLNKHTGLTPGTAYYYKTFSFDASNFYSIGSTANATTLKYAPTLQASNITFASVGNTAMTINWTNGDGDRRIVIINTVNSFTNPTDGTSPTYSTTYSGSGEQVIYNGTSNTASVSGLTSGTQYWFRVYEANNSGTNILYLVTTATNNPNSQFTNTPAAFFEDFENGSKPSYATGTVICTMGSWTMSDALIGNLAADKKNGNWSVRMQNAGYICMNFDVTNGVRDITINSASYSTNAASTWQLQMSTNGGTNWTNVGGLVTTTSVITPTTFNINQSGNVRFQIVKTNSSNKMNIDDITITDYDKIVTTTSTLPLTEYGKLTINGSGINVTLGGSTLITSELAMTNGSLEIGNNTLTLNGGATGTGTITGSASSNLIIGGTGSMGTIYFTSGSEVLGNLTMNRTLSGSVTIGSNLNVNTGLTLTSGIINMGSNTLTLGTSILSLGTLTIADIGSNASYITGNFERWMPAGISGDVYFPVGTTNAYRPAIINYTNDKSSGGKLKVLGNDTDPGSVNPGSSLIDNGYTVDRYSKEAWWRFTTGDITGGSYNITLGAFAINGVSTSNYNLLRLMKRTDNTSNWEFSGTHSDATGSFSTPFVNRTGITNGFSEFAICGYSLDGNTLSNAPLPVHLSSFTSSSNKRNITLNWSTVSENNNSGFDVERKSVDGNNWVKAGFVTGNGTTANASNYSFTDRNLNTGKYKYRLKQIDYNGNYEYFELNGTPEVGVPDKYNISQNYPNPFNPVTKIDMDIPFDSKVSLVLYDITGREIRNLIGSEMKAGYYTHLFDASSLSSGVYFYRVAMNSAKGNFVSSKKMVLLK